MTAGIVIFAHGSRVEAANDAVRAVAEMTARAGGFTQVEVAFLELAEPGLAEAVRRLVNQGQRRILVVPYFLTLGTHLQRDLPAMVESAARSYPDVEIRVTPPLDEHPLLHRIVLDRARAGLEDWR